MIREFAMRADRSTGDQVHPPFSSSENSRFKAGRNADWCIFAAVLADGPLTDEAPQVCAWVPARTAVSVSAEASPGVEQALAARRVGPFGCVTLEGQRGGSLNIKFFLPGFAGPVLRRPMETSARLP